MIVHRDIKPQNVMIQEEDKGEETTIRAKLIDFGVAANVCRDLFFDDMEKAGTLKFMPPEVVSSKDIAVDSRIDSWSLGILMFYCLTKTYPFEGRTVEEIKKNIIDQKLRFPSTHHMQSISSSCKSFI